MIASQRGALARAGLVLVATGVLSIVSVRGYLEDSAATARDLTFGFGVFIALALLASARVPPAWSILFALVVTAGAYIWGATLYGGTDLGILIVVFTAIAAYRFAAEAYRPLVVAGFALWTPALPIFAASIPVLAPPPVVAAAFAAFALLLAAVFFPVADAERNLRRVGLAVLAITVVAAVFERHDVVASRVLAPDDAMAVVAVIALAALAVSRLPDNVVDALASGVALAAYASSESPSSSGRATTSTRSHRRTTRPSSCSRGRTRTSRST